MPAAQSEKLKHPEIGDAFIPYKYLFSKEHHIWNSVSQSKLSKTEKLLWNQLAMFAGKDGQCYPSHEQLAQAIAVSESTVERTLRKLEEKQLVRRVQPTGLKRRMHFHNNYVFLWHEMFNQGMLTLNYDKYQKKQGDFSNQESAKNDIQESAKEHPRVSISDIQDPSLVTSASKEKRKEKRKEEYRNSSSSKSFDSLGKPIDPDTVSPDKLQSTLTPEKIVKYWNLHFKNEPIYSEITLTPKREKYLLARIKEYPTLKEWMELFTTIKNECRFLLGEGDRGWKMSFDWLMKDDAKIIKIREGEYRKNVSKEEQEEAAEEAREDAREERRAREYASKCAKIDKAEAEARDAECNEFLKQRKPVWNEGNYDDVDDDGDYFYDEDDHKRLLPENQQREDAYRKLEREVRIERAKGKTITELEEMFPVKKSS